MTMQGSGYTHEAGAEVEYCNGDGALGQGAAVPGLHRGPAATMGDRARTGEALWHTAMVAQGGGGGGEPCCCWLDNLEISECILSSFLLSELLTASIF